MYPKWLFGFLAINSVSPFKSGKRKAGNLIHSNTCPLGLDMDSFPLPFTSVWKKTAKKTKPFWSKSSSSHLKNAWVSLADSSNTSILGSEHEFTVKFPRAMSGSQETKRSSNQSSHPPRCVGPDSRFTYFHIMDAIWSI